MSTLTKGLIVLLVILTIGAGLVVWKVKFGGHGHGDAAITKLTKEDMQTLLKDANPMALKQLAENPELKQKQVDSIKEFLAVANQARKEGLADDPQIKTFLEFIRAQITASNYDREKNKDKDALPPFSLIKKEDIDNFYQNAANEAKFNDLVKAITEQGKAEGEDAPEPTPEQIQQLKEQYAKVKIYEKEAEEKSAELGEDFKRRTELQIRLQQAAFLNQLYASKVLKDKVKVTDEEVQQYIAQHPEFDPKTKRAKAEEVLQRAKSGGNFEALAKEFSEDPGSKEDGGLYKDVKLGQMAPPFEQAALALEPGKVADNLVETKFGYHIVKLEKKGTAKNKEGKEEQTYDVRHILVSTMFSDPKNPFSQPMPMSEKVKADLQEEKEKKILEEIKANNPIEVEEFEVPKPTDEQIQQMQQQMMQQQQMPTMPQDLEGEEPSTEVPKKPEPKKAPGK